MARTRSRVLASAGMAGALALPGAGCGPRPAATPAATPAPPSAAAPAGAAVFPLTVTDDLGRRVTFPAPPRRILSLAPAHTETLYALGAGERVVAVDTYSDYPPEARRKPRLNCWPRPPLEPIVALKPDLVVLLTQERETIGPMEAAGLPVLKLFPKTYAQAQEGILLLGAVTGSGRAAAKLVTIMRARLRAVETRIRGVRRPRVLFELDAVDPARPYVAGNGGFYGELLALAGGENIFADLKAPAAPVSAEQVVARDPEVILLGDTGAPVNPQSPELLARRPGWGRITAVRTRKVFPVASERMTRPSPRLAEGLDEIARLLHPDRFR